VQAAVLSNYSFDRYLTTEDKVPTLLDEIALTGVPEGDAQAAAKAAATLADCTIFARDMANERADEMHPGRLVRGNVDGTGALIGLRPKVAIRTRRAHTRSPAPTIAIPPPRLPRALQEAIAEAIAKETGAALFVVRGDDLVKAGMHMMAAVGQAARHAPRYIELLYKGDPAHPDDIIMVLGKGITFDSGGLNIKGTGFMEDMHMDMSGEWQSWRSGGQSGTAHRGT
jgi:leucyl aminopeptidase